MIYSNNIIHATEAKARLVIFDSISLYLGTLFE